MRLSVLLSVALSQIGFVCAYLIFVSQNTNAIVQTFTKCTFQDIQEKYPACCADSSGFDPSHGDPIGTQHVCQCIHHRRNRLSVVLLDPTPGSTWSWTGHCAVQPERLCALHRHSCILLRRNRIEHVFIVFFAWSRRASYSTRWSGNLNILLSSSIMIVIPITESMVEPEKFPRVLAVTMAIVALIFGSVGALCYSSFGSEIQTIVLLNFPVRDGMTILSVPLMLSPAYH